ncbi:MAG: type II secretion system protein [Pyrinomonadaceae bacterium]
MSKQSPIKHRQSNTGFTLLELIITLFVLSILVMGTIPLTQNAVKRQKELRLRETLRVIRNAIDEFHRDTIGACPQGAITTTNPAAGRLPQGFGQNTAADPRSRVVIDDCKIFDVENLDRFPPSLDILVEGVKVKPRGLNLKTGGVFDGKNATEQNEETEHNKVYLREIPIDPLTGETDWKLRSSYQTGDAESWDDINVFDVSSSSDGEALNGEKYSDW